MIFKIFSPKNLRVVLLKILFLLMQNIHRYIGFCKEKTPIYLLEIGENRRQL
jgi:hypothetical protein